MENYIKIADYTVEFKQQETNTPAVLKISVGIRIFIFNMDNRKKK